MASEQTGDGVSTRLTLAAEVGLATRDDLPAMVELLGLLFAQEADFTPDTAAQARGLTMILDDPAIGSLMVARRESKVIGMVNLLYTVSTALGERVAWLEDLIVHPAARSAGIGSRLCQAAQAEARKQGCRRITLLTDHDNLVAQRFYARHGFQPSAMRPLRLALD